MQRGLTAFLMTVTMLAMLATVGCAAEPKQNASGYLKRWNNDVRYSIRERGDAFTVNAYYDRTTQQLDPSVASYLERITKAIARAHADEADRELAAVHEDTFRITPVTNRFVLGTMHWRASLDASYQVPPQQ